tara:strand:+ start:1997 stop:2146 length:150 start_codon:yes stop_codon:yes gene_type:complete
MIGLLLLIIGILFICSGYVNQLNPGCKDGTEIRILPRHVYDQVIKDATL